MSIYNINGLSKIFLSPSKENTKWPTDELCGVPFLLKEQNFDYQADLKRIL